MEITPWWTAQTITIEERYISILWVIITHKTKDTLLHSPFSRSMSVQLNRDDTQYHILSIRLMTALRPTT